MSAATVIRKKEYIVCFKDTLFDGRYLVKGQAVKR
jgi:hypothetical protein